MINRTVDFQIRTKLRDCYLQQLEYAEISGVPMRDAKDLIFEILLGLFLATNDIGTAHLNRVERGQNFREELNKFASGASTCFAQELNTDPLKEEN